MIFLILSAFLLSSHSFTHTHNFTSHLLFNMSRVKHADELLKSDFKYLFLQVSSIHIFL